MKIELYKIIKILWQAKMTRSIKMKLNKSDGQTNEHLQIYSNNTITIKHYIEKSE